MKTNINSKLAPSKNDPAEAFGRYARDFFSPYFSDEDDDEDLRDDSEVGIDPGDMWFDLSGDEQPRTKEVRGEQFPTHLTVI